MNPQNDKITVIDCNNFWSSSGGGVRRYHLEKLKNFERADRFIYVFIMHDEKSYTEKLNGTTIIEHIKVPKVMGNSDYRFLLRPGPLASLFEKYRPDIVECGSPYVLPWLIRMAARKLKKKPLLTAFWHADFPVTYVERILGKKKPALGNIMGKLAWRYASLNFKTFDAIFVSSEAIARRMSERGLPKLCHAPLGIDTRMFNVSKRDETKVSELKSGEPERLTVFFPHRFCEEKGLRTLLEAWPKVIACLPVEPAIVFAGTGPDLDRVKEAVKIYKHTRYIGFITDQTEIAAWYASCDLGLVLSGWETFGLSLLEALSSGQLLITANIGAAAEHMQNAGAGITIPTNNAEALAEAILKIAADRGDKYRGKSLEYVEKFTWDNCFENLRKFYSLLVDNKQKGVSLTRSFTQIDA